MCFLGRVYNQVSKVLKVQIVEDDAHIRARLVQVVEEHSRLNLVANSATFSEAKKALQKLPDILLVDLGLPDGDGEDLIRFAVRQSKSLTKCIVFSVFGDEKRVVRAIEAGASGYLLKDSDVADIPQVIINMAKGDVPISPAIARHLLKRFYVNNNQGVNEKNVSLSTREIEVLQYVSKGYSVKEIAGYMGVSYHTVVSHTKNIYKKLKVNSRSEAVFKAQKTGLINIGHSS